jgi:hypothetical protein
MLQGYCSVTNSLIVLEIVVEVASCETWMMMEVVEATKYYYHYLLLLGEEVVSYFPWKRKVVVVVVKNPSFLVVVVRASFDQRVVWTLLVVVVVMERPLPGVGMWMEVAMTPMVVAVALLMTEVVQMMVVEKVEILQARGKTW